MDWSMMKTLPGDEGAWSGSCAQNRKILLLRKNKNLLDVLSNNRQESIFVFSVRTLLNYVETKEKPGRMQKVNSWLAEEKRNAVRKPLPIDLNTWEKPDDLAELYNSNVPLIIEAMPSLKAFIEKWTSSKEEHMVLETVKIIACE